MNDSVQSVKCHSILHLSVCLGLLISTSCAPLLTTDNDLRQRITGTWRFHDHKQVWVFNADGSCIDTAWFRLSDHSGDDDAIMVIKSQYSITRGILRYSNPSFELSFPSGHPEHEQNLITPMRISIRGDTLCSDLVRLFAADSNTANTLDGRWMSEEFLYSGPPETVRDPYCGRIRTTISFSGEGHNYESAVDMPDGPSPKMHTKSGKYAFDPPFLELDRNRIPIRVEFVDGKMLWYPPSQTGHAYRAR